MISTVPEPGESRVLRESAATFLAEAVLGGQRVALEEFDVVRAEPHFMKCMAEQPTPGTPTNPSATPLPCPLDGVHDGIPKGYEVRVVLTPDQPTLDDLDGEVKVYEFPDPTRPHAPDDGVAGAVEGLVRVARSIAAGDGVWDRDDLARALLNLSEVERNGSGQGSC